jgi:hypothetical protein
MKWSPFLGLFGVYGIGVLVRYWWGLRPPSAVELVLGQVATLAGGDGRSVGGGVPCLGFLVGPVAEPDA